MAVFFNGRLWTSPAVMSVVDDSAMYNKNISVGNVLCIIGSAEGGEPYKPLRFGSASEARDVLVGGELLKAIEKAFDPSSETAAPATVIAMRIDPATQSTLTLKDAAAANVINLVSTGFGLYTTGIKVKVESGSLYGKKVSSQFGQNYYVKDNLYREMISVQYTGAELTATVTFDGTNLTLHAPAGTKVVDLPVASYPTIQQMVDIINTQVGFVATVLDGNGQHYSVDLDGVTAADCKTAAVKVTGTLAEVINWINGAGEGFLNATKAVGALQPPVNKDWTYLTGGTTGTATTTDYQNCFTALQSEDVQWVVPLSSSAAIHAMADAHCAYMSNVARMERRAVCGMALGSTDTVAIGAARDLNSDRTSLIHLGFYDYDSTGKLTLYPPYMLAALVGGAFSGVNPGTALTNKALKVRGLERKLRNPTDTDPLIDGGVLCVEETKTGYKVVKSISTWLINDNYNRVEVSTGVAADFVSRNVRNALQSLLGQKGNPTTLMLAVEKTDSILRELARPEPIGPGVIVGDKTNPAFKNITASLEGDVLRVEFQCSPVIPINYIPIVIHAVPWSGTATV